MPKRVFFTSGPKRRKRIGPGFGGFGYKGGIHSGSKALKRAGKTGRYRRK